MSGTLEQTQVRGRSEQKKIIKQLLNNSGLLCKGKQTVNGNGGNKYIKVYGRNKIYSEKKRR